MVHSGWRVEEGKIGVVVSINCLVEEWSWLHCCILIIRTSESMPEVGRNGEEIRVFFAVVKSWGPCVDSASTRGKKPYAGVLPSV